MAVKGVGRGDALGLQARPGSRAVCVCLLRPRSGSKTGEPSAANKRTRCIKVGAGAARGGGARAEARRCPKICAALTPPVLPCRRYLGHGQPPGRLQGGALREHGRPADAFPTGSSFFFPLSFAGGGGLPLSVLQGSSRPPRKKRGRFYKRAFIDPLAHIKITL